MLVVVRRPRTEFSLNGDVPRKLIQSLVSEYGPDNVKIEEDDMMNVEDMEWYKEEAAKDMICSRQNSPFLSQAKGYDSA